MEINLNGLNIIVGFITVLVTYLLINPLRVAISGLQKSIDQLNVRIDQLSVKHDLAQTEINNLRERLASVDAAASSAHKRLDMHEQRLVAVEHKCDACKKE